MLYGLCLRGYTPYARGQRSGSIEWKIERMARKKKSANLFILFKAVNKCLYHILPIIHAYNAGTS
jgi:hypothetical protein